MEPITCDALIRQESIHNCLLGFAELPELATVDISGLLGSKPLRADATLVVDLHVPNVRIRVVQIPTTSSLDVPSQFANSVIIVIRAWHELTIDKVFMCNPVIGGFRSQPIVSKEEHSSITFTCKKMSIAQHMLLYPRRPLVDTPKNFTFVKVIPPPCLALTMRLHETQVTAP